MVMARFLLASLNMDAILAEGTIHRRRQALDRMTKGFGLQDAYDTTLDRIRQQGGSRARLGMEALMWISRCERPLGSQELCNALGVESGSEDFSFQNVPSIRTVLCYTLGLVTIDDQGSTPRLLHFTLQEYLGQHPTLFVTADSMMAEICLTYLNSQSVWALAPDPEKALEIAPFLEYATCFWGAHAARGVTELAESLALRLLDRYESHVSAAVLWRNKIYKEGEVRYVRGISGLHCIAFWGIKEMAVAILGMKRWQVNGCDSRGETPLMWAVKYGNSRMVELFLAQEDIEPDMITREGCTALSLAAQLGSEDAVKLLLGCGDVNPNLPDSNGRTSISFAAELGNEDVLKLLLGWEDVGPDLPDDNGRTPLSFAAREGHGGAVKLLLRRGDVNPNSPDGHGQTPLSFAAEEGHECVVELLLQRGDVNPNSPDSSGRTSISFAAERGHERIVKLLLERGDANSNFPDSNGRTPLSLAASWRHGDVVKLFLERGDVNPNSSDNQGRTPLSFAIEGRGPTQLVPSEGARPPPASEEDGVVKLLLERRDVNPNLPDSLGQTPLSMAALWGHESVVKLLLKRGDINPNFPDRNGSTALWFAARWGHEGVVKLLLERGDVNPNPSDSNGQTPLLFAILRADQGVVKLLLQRGDVNPNSSDSKGRKPLSFAAVRGHEGVVKLLLTRRDVDPNSADSDGRTPLSFAAERGHEGVVKLLWHGGMLILIQQIAMVVHLYHSLPPADMKV